MQRPPFTALAAVYDAIMADVEYDHWADFILTYARDQHLDARRALIGALMTVKLLPAPRGRKGFDPATVQIEWRHPQT